MKYSKVDEIECGEKTCASGPGKFCRYLGISKFGMMAECRKFDGVVLEVPKWGISWTHRSKQCLDSYRLAGNSGSRDDRAYVLNVVDTLGRGSNEPVLIPDHNNQDPPVYRKHMESVGLMVRNIAGRVYVFNKENGRVWEYDEIEWSYGASGQLMVNHNPIHRGVVPRDVLDGVLEGK